MWAMNKRNLNESNHYHCISLLVSCQGNVYLTMCSFLMGFPGGSAGKESTCIEGVLVSIPGLGRSPREGNGYLFQCSGLVNSMNCIQSMGSQRVGQDWAQSLKNPPAMQETACNAGDPVLILGFRRSHGEGKSYPVQYSCLENSVDRGAWWTKDHGYKMSFFSVTKVPRSRPSTLHAFWKICQGAYVCLQDCLNSQVPKHNTKLYWIVSYDKGSFYSLLILDKHKILV